MEREKRKGIKQNISLSFLLLLLLQTHLSQELFVIILFVYILVFMYVEKYIISSEFLREIKIPVLLILGGMGVGAYCYNSNQIEFRDYFRDIYYFITPVIAILIGFLYRQKKICLEKIFNTIIICGTINSLRRIISILLNISVLREITNVYYWRKAVGHGDYIGTVALVLLLTFRPNSKCLTKWIRYVSLLLCGSVFVISMSRTNILIFIVMFLCQVERKLIDRGMVKIKYIKSGCCVLLISSVLILLLNITNIGIINAFGDKLANSISEININDDWSSAVRVETNWRGYETYCAIKEWQEYDWIAKIIGRGFGKRVFVGEYAYTLLDVVTSTGIPETTIPILHNGYATMLVKLGILGLTLYLYFYISIIKNGIEKCKNGQEELYATNMQIGIGCTLLLITFFLNGLFVSGCPFFVLIFFIGYFTTKKSKE